MRWTLAARRNHALEHATVGVYLARYGPTRLAGRASADGFFIVGDLDLEAVEDCAREALQRLRDDHSKHCGGESIGESARCQPEHGCGCARSEQTGNRDVGAAER